MAYTKNTWNTGDIVSSQKLNHMEDGVAAAYEVMVINDTDGTLDKTWQEIYDAMAQGKLCVVRADLRKPGEGISANLASQVYINEGKYAVGDGNNMYFASSATGYAQRPEVS